MTASAQVQVLSFTKGPHCDFLYFPRWSHRAPEKKRPNRTSWQGHVSLFCGIPFLVGLKGSGKNNKKQQRPHLKGWAHLETTPQKRLTFLGGNPRGELDPCRGCSRLARRIIPRPDGRLGPLRVTKSVCLLFKSILFVSHKKKRRDTTSCCGLRLFFKTRPALHALQADALLQKPWLSHFFLRQGIVNSGLPKGFAQRRAARRVI